MRCGGYEGIRFRGGGWLEGRERGMRGGRMKGVVSRMVVVDVSLLAVTSFAVVYLWCWAHSQSGHLEEGRDI